MRRKSHKIALFGTSADPPTNAHKQILELLANEFDLVISYASSNPSKKHEANFSQRSLLLETLINNINNQKVIFDQEISSPWAINSIKACKEKHPDGEINFVIGSDLLEELLSWKHIKIILKEIRLLIIPRQGYATNKKILTTIENYGGLFDISAYKIAAISSSMFRTNPKESNLHKSVLEIIKNNNLYNSLNIR